MKFRQSTLVLSLVLAPFFIASYVSPARSVVTTDSSNRQTATIQRYTTNLQSSRNRLPELQAYIEKQDWGEVRSFIRGPLGELEVRLNRLKTSLPSAQQSPLERRINSLSQHLNRIDSSAGQGKSELAIEQYQAFVSDFDEVFKQLNIPIVAIPKQEAPSIPTSNSPIQEASQKAEKTQQKPAVKPSVQTRSVNASSDQILAAKQENLTLKTTPTINKSPTRVSTDNSSKNVIETMNTDITPAYGFMAFFALLIITIFLQVRYQFTSQCLNTQIELLKQGKPLPKEATHQLKVEQPYKEGRFQPPTAEDLPQIWCKLTDRQSTQASLKESLQTPEVMKVLSTIAAVFAATIATIKRLVDLNPEPSKESAQADSTSNNSSKTRRSEATFQPLTADHFKQMWHKLVD